MSASAFPQRSPLSVEDVVAASRRISPILPPTQLIESSLGEGVFLKLEITNVTGSFKIRGALNALTCRLDQARSMGVICSSTGNHARAVARAAALNDVEAVICVSNLVPQAKIGALRAQRATVRIVGRNYDEAQAEVDRLVEEFGYVEIPPFDHPEVISGQGTIALELLRQNPALAAIVVPLSGGGLAGGIALAAKAIKPGIRIIGVSMDRGAAMAESIKAGKPMLVDEVASLADSLGGGIGLANQYSFDLCRRLIDEFVLVSEAEIYRGLSYILREERLYVEGAAAVGHAAILGDKLSHCPKPMALIISGRNAEPDHISRVLANLSIRLSDDMKVNP